MISTRSAVKDLSDVPLEWIFEHYLNLTEKLCGQEVRIKSVFNLNDKDPSMYLYVHKTSGKYKYKDFSTGKGGDALDLIQNMYNLGSRAECAQKILNEYSDFLKRDRFQEREFKVHTKFHVTDYEVRSWTQNDANFWTQFHIDSGTLEFFKVRPLAWYMMENTGEGRSFKVANTYMYGYFKMDGTLYKIYQPMSRERKYIKVADYLQGSEQLEYKQPYLVIASGIKDMSVIKRLNFKVELVGPDSENNIIKPELIATWVHQYKGVCTLFDNDEAGLKAMHQYRDTYNLPFVHLQFQDDIAKASKAVGLVKLREMLYPLFKEAFHVKL